MSGWRGRRDVLRGGAVVALTVTVLAILVQRADAAAILAAAGRLPTAVWMSALAIAAAFPLLAATRWWIMMRAVGSPQPLRMLLACHLGICPVNLVSPSKSGDLLRALALRGRAAASDVVAALIVERTFDVAMLCLFVLAGGALSGRIPATPTIILAICAGGVILAAVFAAGRHRLPATVAAWLAEFGAALRRVVARPTLLAATASVTAAHWLLVGLLVTLMLAGSGADVTLADTITAMPAAILVGMAPITLAGMGTREGAMLLLFASTAGPAQILAAGLLYTLLVYWLPALAGLPFTRSVLRFDRGA